ncbi:hypothetical protein EH196_19235 [Bacillus sp. C1-1]|nr:hypothetical protein EH196_19235 [Bacillus sp. C1-1]
MNYNEFEKRIIGWLEEKNNKQVYFDDPLYGNLINSLELLELISYLEVEFNFTVSISELTNNSIQKVNQFILDIYRNISFYNREWYSINIEEDVLDFKSWLDVQFQRKISLKVDNEQLLIGIPYEDKDREMILEKISRVVNSIEKLQYD